jgi:hypothetical protein
MLANLRIGLSWFRSALAWWVVESGLAAYLRLERFCKKLCGPHAFVFRR